jgi:hypothetical protein
MQNNAIRAYVRNEFEKNELVFQSGPSPLHKGRVLISEILQGVLNRDYRYTVSKYGYGLALSGTAQLGEVIRRFQHKLRYLYLYPHPKKWLRENELLDFKIITPLIGLRGLSVGYMLDSCHASAIEELSKLEYLSLAWKIDEGVDLKKLDRLRELVIFGSPHLESTWDLHSLRKLAISHHVHSTLEVASRLTDIEKLRIGESPRLASLKGIDNLKELRFLGLYANSNLTNLDGITDAKPLEYIVIDGCSRLESIDAVTELPNLKYLEVRNCPSLKLIKAFPARPNLTHVFFMEGTRPKRPIEEVLANLPNLKYYFGG